MVILSVLLSFSSVQTKLANVVTSWVNSKYKTSIEIDRVDLSSLRTIQLKNVLIRDHHQDTLIFAGNLKTSILNYKNIFESNLEFGDIKIEDGKFLMKTYKDEESNNFTIFIRKFENDEKSEKTVKLTSSSINIVDLNFVLTDENKKETPIVYYSNINGYFDNFKVNGSNVSTSIHDLKTIENHNINIVDFKTDFSFSNTKMELLKTVLKTEKSNLSADIVFNYNEGDLSNFTDKVHIDANIISGDIVLPDLKKLYDEFGKNDQIHFTAHAKGTINDFVLNDVDLKSDRNSSFKGTVKLTDVLHPKKFKLEADIKKLSSSFDHLVNLFPKLLGGKIPASLEKAGYFSSNGKVFLTSTSIDAKLNTRSEIGNSKVDIELTNFDQIENALYKGKIELIDFNLGKFVNDSLIGELSMVGEVNGKGTTIENINIKITGAVTKHQYKGYTYSNIDINGTFKDKHFNGELIVNDPGIQLIFKGLADFSGEKYIFDFNADVDFADFYKLNLFTRDERSILKGKIDINLIGSNLDNIEGDIRFIDAVYINQNDIYNFKDFNISSKRNDSIREVYINSTDIINGSVIGNFKFKELGKLAKNSLGSLYGNYQKEVVSGGQFLDFHFNIYNKIIEVFYPKVKLGPNSIIKGEINSDEDKFVLYIKSPEVEAFDVFVEDIDLQINNKNPLFNTLLSVDKIDSKYYNIANVNLVNIVLNDTLFMRTDFIGGRELKESYEFSFYHTINEKNQSIFGINKSEIKFKNNTWKINPNSNDQNKLVFDENFKTYAIDNINMESGNQHIDLAGLINGVDTQFIDLKLENVNLYDITPDIDSVRIDGKLNGSINFKKVNGKTLPYADLTINYFNINSDYYGDLTLKAESDQSTKNYNFDIELINSDLKSFYSKGSIDLNSEDPTIIASTKFDNFKINAFSPLGKNVLTNIRGLASGEVSITGIIKNPDIDGEINLVGAGIELPYLNVNYDFIENAKVRLYGQTFDFQPMTIQDDVMKTKGIMKGTITHKEFKKWDLDLELSTDNLLILNTEDKENAIYYGTGLLAGKTTLKGYTDELIINVDGTTNPGTEFIIPINYVSTVNESRLIHFVDYTKIEEDIERPNEIVFEQLKGLSINFNLKVTKDAVAEIVIDRITGSLLRGSGDGDLKLNIDTKGKFEMYGTLVIDNGEYQFKNIINKDFNVKKGGTIVWEGSPYDAILNIEAVNHTKANPAVLLDEIASSRKIDVDLVTIMTGPLSSPNFKFDVQIPNSSSLVVSELEFKLSNEDEMLNQFISLLVTGSFTSSEKDKTNFNSNAAITSAIAQKASQLMSNVLGSDDDKFQVGVTYDIGTTNSVKDVTTDDQLGFEVSGRIADKVIVNGKVGVPVGSNTSSNVIGEVEVILPLNQAETFQAKVYNRQNEIQFDVLEGEGYTQGVGIAYFFNFDNSKEFFEKIGLKKTEEEKNLTKEQRDSIKKEDKLLKKQAKLNN